MVILTLTDEQVVELVKQLPPERRRAVLLELAADAAAKRESRLKQAEDRLRRIAAERGLDWDKMAEPEREALVDELAHEDRECAR